MSTSPSPSSLPSPVLARRLSELCRAERNLQADFLLHLAEFDSRHAYLEAGYGSLWSYCTEALHLRESAAGRRTRAMSILRDFPRLEPALRDGRLCLSTLCKLGPLLTDANLDDLVAQAAFRSKADVERLVVTLQPRVAPREGIRRLARNGVERTDDVVGSVPDAPAPASRGELALVPSPEAPASSQPAGAARSGGAVCASPGGPRLDSARTLAAPPPRRAHPDVELQPVAKDLYSLRVTIDEAFRRDLEELAALTSHTHRRDLRAVLHDALRCGIAKHGKRRGAVAPERKRSGKGSRSPAAVDAADPRRTEPSAANEPTSAAPPVRDPRYIPIEVRRAVWDRDGGRCAWVSPDGRRCGSRYQLEVDHIEPVALGGRSTLANCRLACKAHNIHSGFKTLGFEIMAPHLGKFTDPSGSHL